MNPTSTIAKALAACLMVSCCVEAAGQDSASSRQPGREAAVQPLIDLKFSGGSAADYARAVQRAAPGVPKRRNGAGAGCPVSAVDGGSARPAF